MKNYRSFSVNQNFVRKHPPTNPDSISNPVWCQRHSLWPYRVYYHIVLCKKYVTMFRFRIGQQMSRLTILQLQLNVLNTPEAIWCKTSTVNMLQNRPLSDLKKIFMTKSAQNMLRNGNNHIFQFDFATNCIVGKGNCKTTRKGEQIRKPQWKTIKLNNYRTPINKQGDKHSKIQYAITQLRKSSCLRPEARLITKHSLVFTFQLSPRKSYWKFWKYYELFQTLSINSKAKRIQDRTPVYDARCGYY